MDICSHLITCNQDEALFLNHLFEILFVIHSFWELFKSFDNVQVNNINIYNSFFVWKYINIQHTKSYQVHRLLQSNKSMKRFTHFSWINLLKNIYYFKQTNLFKEFRTSIIIKWITTSLKTHFTNMFFTSITSFYFDPSYVSTFLSKLWVRILIIIPQLHQFNQK